MRIRPDFFRPRAFWIVEEDTVQGYVDLDDPGNLNLEYTKLIADVLEFLDFGNVVHIGGGGLMMPRYILHKNPWVLQTVFEPDIDMIDFIGKTLKTLDGFNVVNMTGEDGIAKLPNDFTHLTIVDGFQNGKVPPGLLTESFFRDLFRISHTVIMNTIQEGPREIPDTDYPHGLVIAPKTSQEANVLFVWSKDYLPVEEIKSKLPLTHEAVRLVSSRR